MKKNIITRTKALLTLAISLCMVFMLSAAASASVPMGYYIKDSGAAHEYTYYSLDYALEDISTFLNILDSTNTSNVIWVDEEEKFVSLSNWDAGTAEITSVENDLWSVNYWDIEKNAAFELNISAGVELSGAANKTGFDFVLSRAVSGLAAGNLTLKDSGNNNVVITVLTNASSDQKNFRVSASIIPGQTYTLTLNKAGWDFVNTFNNLTVPAEIISVADYAVSDLTTTGFNLNLNSATPGLLKTNFDLADENGNIVTINGCTTADGGLTYVFTTDALKGEMTYYLTCPGTRYELSSAVFFVTPAIDVNLNISAVTLRDFNVNLVPGVNGIPSTNFVLKNSSNNRMLSSIVSRTGDPTSVYKMGVFPSLIGGADYTLETSLKGYDFGAAQTITPNKINVSMNVSNPSTSGFDLTLSAPVTGLSASNFTFNNSANAAVTFSVSTTDNVHFRFSTEIQAGAFYTIATTKNGYNFGAARTVYAPVSITGAGAVNGSVYVFFDGEPDPAPVANDFTITRSVNGGASSNINATALNWDAVTRKMVLNVDQVPATGAQIQVTGTVSYMGTSFPYSFTVFPSVSYVALTITSITNPAQDVTMLALPNVPAGFTIAIKSATTGVISTTGAIFPAAEDSTVGLVLTVTQTATGLTADTATINVVVPGSPTTVARSFTTITVSAGATTLTLPTIPNGYTRAIKSSSNTNVIALDGTVTPPYTATTVDLVYEITKTANGTKADTAAISVAVPQSPATAAVNAANDSSTMQTALTSAQLGLTLTGYNNLLAADKIIVANRVITLRPAGGFLTKASVQTALDQAVTYANDRNTVIGVKDTLTPGYAGSDSASSVTQNLIPITSSNGVTITWSTDSPLVIETDGTVHIPTYTVGNKTVVFQAALVKGEYSDTKTFTLTVIKLIQTETEALAQLNAAANTADMQTALTNTALALNQGGYDGLISTQKTTVANALIAGKPYANKAAVQTALDNAVTSISDLSAVAAVKSALVVGYSGSDTSSSVTGNLILAALQDGVTITWSSNPNIIAADGTVTRPSYTAGNATVTLTANLSKNAASDSKQFTLTVIKLAQTETEALAVLNAAATTTNMQTAIANAVLALTLTDYNALTAAQKITVIQAVLANKPTGGYPNKAAVQTALDNAVGSITDLGDVIAVQSALTIGYGGTDTSTRVTLDLTLATELEGVTIAWSSSPAIIAANGTVTRPSFTAGNAAVTLTAYLSKNAAQVTKQFTLTVIKLDQSVTEAVTQLNAAATATDMKIALTNSKLGLTLTEYNALTAEYKTTAATAMVAGRPYADKAAVQTALNSAIGAITDSSLVATAKNALVIGYSVGDSINSVTGNLTLLTTQGGVDVTWVSNPAIIAGNGTVTRPSFTSGNTTVTLTASLSKNLATDTKQFTVTVVKLVQTEDEALVQLNAAATAATMQTAITNPQLGLTLTGFNALNIADKTTVSTGMLTGKPYASKAAVQSALDTAVGSIADLNAIAAVKTALVIGYSGSDTSSSVTGNLILDASENDVTIAWSSNPAIIAADGTVTRPSFTAGNTIVTLTASLSKNSATGTKQFTVTVIKLAQSEAEALIQLNAAANTEDMQTAITNPQLALTLTGYNALNTTEKARIASAMLSGRPYADKAAVQTALTTAVGSMPDINAIAAVKTALAIGYNGSDTSISVTQNLNLTTSQGGVTIVWSSNPSIIAANGTVSRPSLAQGNTTVTLTATLSKNGITDTKQFTVIVIELQTEAEALAQLNAAANAADMQAAITNLRLGLDLTTYNTLTSAQKTSVVADMLANKPSGGYATKTDVQTELDNLVNPLDDLNAVEAVKSALVIGYITGDSAGSVTGNVTLTTVQGGVTITWASNSSAITTGGTVTRPSFTAGNATVTLTASLSKNAAVDTKQFTLTVIKLPQAAVPTITNVTVGGISPAVSGTTLTFSVNPATAYTTGTATLNTNVNYRIQSGTTVNVTGSATTSENLVTTALNVLAAAGGTPGDGVTGGTLITRSPITITLTAATDDTVQTVYTINFVSSVAVNAPTITNVTVGGITPDVSGTALTFAVDPSVAYTTGTATLSGNVNYRIQSGTSIDVSGSATTSENLVTTALNVLAAAGGTPGDGVLGGTLIAKSPVIITLKAQLDQTKQTVYTINFAAVKPIITNVTVGGIAPALSGTSTAPILTFSVDPTTAYSTGTATLTTNVAYRIQSGTTIDVSGSATTSENLVTTALNVLAAAGGTPGDGVLGGALITRSPVTITLKAQYDLNVETNYTIYFVSSVTIGAPTLTGVTVGGINPIVSGTGTAPILTFNVNPAVAYTTGMATLSENVTYTIESGADVDVSGSATTSENLVTTALNVLAAAGGTPGDGVLGATLIAKSPVTITLKAMYDQTKQTVYTIYFVEPHTPAAPTNPAQNDAANTFGWTNVTGFNAPGDYEYSVNSGTDWTTCTANPQTILDEAYAIGAVRVRVKADASIGRPVGLSLVSTAAYTVTPPETPAAPTNPVQDDTANTFGWTNVTGFDAPGDYEYSLNSGTDWTTCTANPISVDNVALAIGAVQVRVKADATTSRPVGAVLVSTAAYTISYAIPAHTFGVYDSLVPGKKTVVVIFTGVDDENDYNVTVGITPLAYDSDADWFIGDVPIADAIEANLTIEHK